MRSKRGIPKPLSTLTGRREQSRRPYCPSPSPSTQRRKPRAANRMSAAPKLPADSVNLIIPDLLPACVTELKAAEQLLGTANAAVAQLVRGGDGHIEAARQEEERVATDG